MIGHWFFPSPNPTTGSLMKFPQHWLLKHAFILPWNPSCLMDSFPYPLHLSLLCHRRAWPWKQKTETGKYIIRNAKAKMLSVWKNVPQTKFNTHLFVQLFLIEGRKSWQTEKIYNIVCIVEENLDFGLSPSIVTWLLQCAVNLWSEPLLVSPSQPQHELKPVAWSWISDKDTCL